MAYISFGLRNRDRLMLILGLITLGFSIFTYKFYFSILPVEIALTVGGILLIALAGGLIHYLRTLSVIPLAEKKRLLMAFTKCLVSLADGFHNLK